MKVDIAALLGLVGTLWWLQGMCPPLPPAWRWPVLLFWDTVSSVLFDFNSVTCDKSAENPLYYPSWHAFLYAVRRSPRRLA